jgi:hypothetical protein
MRTGVGLLVIAVGAILAFAVKANTSVINLHIAGWVLIVIGLIGMLLPGRTYGWVGRRLLVKKTRQWPGNEPGNESVEKRNIPPYVSYNPGTSRIRAGLPPRPTLLTDSRGGVEDPVEEGGRPTAPGDTEVIEDMYEE